MIVCNGNLPFHDWTHSDVGDQRLLSVCWKWDEEATVGGEEG
jgi:hypothetical protein